jgi:hypothetical protein
MIPCRFEDRGGKKYEVPIDWTWSLSDPGTLKAALKWVIGVDPLKLEFMKIEALCPQCKEPVPIVGITHVGCLSCGWQQNPERP